LRGFPRAAMLRCIPPMSIPYNGENFPGCHRIPGTRVGCARLYMSQSSALSLRRSAPHESQAHFV
jgi:hypothetical protein